MTIARDEELMAFLAGMAGDRVTHRHRLSGRRRFIQQGRIGQRETGQIPDHGLKGDKSLQAALRDLSLVRSVLRIPSRVFENVPLNHPRCDTVVVPHADQRAINLVLGRDALESRKNGLLALTVGNVQGLPKTDIRWNGRIDECVERLVA